MALKFRRRQKLFPGVYLNFSSKGISTTIGVKGFSVNLGQKGVYLNTGLPGTGLYDRKKIFNWNDKSTSSPEDFSFPDTSNFEEDPYYFIPRKLEGEIKSKDANSVTSKGLAAVKETLLAAFNEKNELQIEIPEIEAEVKNAATIKLLSKILLFGFFTNKFKEQLSEKMQYLNNLKQQLSECKVTIDINIDENLKSRYERLRKSFDYLSKSHKIWDTTSSLINNDNRSTANQVVTRESTFLATQRIDFINTDFDALLFKNKNGSDIYIYPAFAILFDDKSSFGIVDLFELNLSFKRTKFLEKEDVSYDTKVVGQTWVKVNIDGTPDKRFKNNYKIPIVEYGEIEFKSYTGVNELFMFSNPIRANNFVETFKSYIAPSYSPYLIEDKIIDRSPFMEPKTYTSSKQTAIIGTNTYDSKFQGKRVLILSSNFYKIELPDNTVISGSLARQPDKENQKNVYLTEKGCPLVIGENTIFVNLLKTHNAAYTFHLE